MTPSRTFEELCILASRNRWCWKIPCTTCGNQDFRLGLAELADGELSEEWWSSPDRRSARQRTLKYANALRPWPMQVQQALVERVASAKLILIAQQGRFPDWLGLIGIALQITEEVEISDRRLTQSWGRQLIEIAQNGHRGRALELGPFAEGGAVLTWRSLESLEDGLRRSLRVSEGG